METNNERPRNPETFTTYAEFWRYFADKFQNTPRESMDFFEVQQRYCWSVLAMTQEIPIAIKDKYTKMNTRTEIFQVLFNEGYQSYQGGFKFDNMNVSSYENAIRPYVEPQYQHVENPRITIDTLRRIALSPYPSELEQ